MKTSQTELILEALKDHEEGLHPTYFVMELKIFQYSARIHELRTQFGCTHRNGGMCFANEHIINETLKNGTTLFHYEKTEDQVKKAVEETIKENDVISEQRNLL